MDGVGRQTEREKGALLLPLVFFPGSLSLFSSEQMAGSVAPSSPRPLPTRRHRTRSLTEPLHSSFTLPLSLSRSPSFFHQFSFSSLLRWFDNIPLLFLVPFPLAVAAQSSSSSSPSQTGRSQRSSVRRPACMQGRVILLARS